MKKPSLLDLRLFNLIMAGLHFMQAIVVLLIADWKVTLPVTTSFLQFNIADQALEPAQATLFDLPLVAVVVGFLLLSALAHLVISTLYHKQYQKDLEQGINKFRWIEYAISASTMMVGIAMLVGIYDLSALLMIFGLVAIMNLLGLVMELHALDRRALNKPISWLSFNLGSLAGILPWLVVALYFWGSNKYGTGDIPTFVYWIFGTIFVFFNCFALNMYLQYKQIGPWKNYLYGERAYIILSLVAKSALAWQLFAGTLRP